MRSGSFSIFQAFPIEAPMRTIRCLTGELCTVIISSTNPPTAEGPINNPIITLKRKYHKTEDFLKFSRSKLLLLPFPFQKDDRLPPFAGRAFLRLVRIAFRPALIGPGDHPIQPFI